ncbi:hypothetical protein [Silanimonas lenta]|uniref:hypothetical protein n=1 Tax=Silanimonas lenta TaxID=265429 RepID=UPI002FDF452C
MAVDSCGDAALVVNGGLGVFTVVADTTITGANGTTLTTCQVRRGTSGPTKNFTAIKAGT